MDTMSDGEEERKAMAQLVGSLQARGCQAERDELASAIAEDLTPWPVSDLLLAGILRNGDYDAILRHRKMLTSAGTRGAEADQAYSRIVATHALISSRAIRMEKMRIDIFLDAMEGIPDPGKDAGRRFEPIEYGASNAARELFSSTLLCLVDALDLRQMRRAYALMGSRSRRLALIGEWAGKAPMQRDIALFFSDELHPILQSAGDGRKTERLRVLAILQRIDEGLGLIKAKPKPLDFKLPL